MLTALLELAAHAEARLAFDDVRETVALAGDGVRLAVIDGELHSARDVHADGVRDDGVVGRQHAADRQAIAHVGIRHQRARHGDRQRARIAHLLHRVCFEALAPLAPRREFRPRRKGRPIERPSQRRPQFICEERRRISDDVENLRLQLRSVITLRDEVPNELVRQPGRLTTGHAKTNKVIWSSCLLRLTQQPALLAQELLVHPKPRSLCDLCAMLSLIHVFSPGCRAVYHPLPYA